MALTNTWPGVTGAATTTDARKNLAGLLETNASGAVRSGIFPSNTNAIVTARADMNLDIAIFQGATVQFGGPILIANDGVAQLPSVLVSPGSGTNYYVIYAKQNESTAPGTDASNTKVFGAQLSTASFAAARAAMPTGALELATVQMPTGKTATNNAGVTITQTFLYTAAEGGVVWVRNSTERDAWTPLDGAQVFQIDTGKLMIRSGGAWVRLVPAGGGAVSSSTNASGEITITHGLGFTPTAVTATMAADSPVIPHLLHVQVRAIGSTTFVLRFLRRDTEAPMASNPVAAYWTAVG